MNTKKNFGDFVLDLQESKDIENIWTTFLNYFDIENIKDNSYLIIKCPFTHIKIHTKNNKFIIKNLKENNFNLKEVSNNESEYILNNTDKSISAYANLPFAEIEFSVLLDNSVNIDLFEDSNEINTIIKFFKNQLNILMQIDLLKMHSIKDDLTLLFNQNYLKSFIEREINRSKRYNLQFSVIFFDLDYLKDINEKHGHLVGTEVLKEVSRILKESIRNIDVVARFGGDEFVIVLSDSNPELALRISKRLRKRIKENNFLEKEGLNLKISGCFGISNFPEHGNSVKDLIKKADMAMYDVKRSGKDGIKIYTGE
jgi:diguanylate cyclase (GGDEF)-like protein